MEDEYLNICLAHQEERCSLLDNLEKEQNIYVSNTPPASRNAKIQKLIAKHRVECFKKRKEEDGKK